jgi:hypothetical protein
VPKHAHHDRPAEQVTSRSRSWPRAPRFRLVDHGSGAGDGPHPMEVRVAFARLEKTSLRLRRD